MEADCPDCAGTGEGSYDGASCRTCKGSGVYGWIDEDELDEEFEDEEEFEDSEV